MRRIILLLTAFALCLSMAACGSKAPTPTTPADPNSVTITIPADLAGVQSNKDLKARFSGEGYLDAVLTEDGNVVLTMTREKHTALIADTELSIRESLEATVSAGDTSFTRIDVNDDFTHYTVYIAGETLNTGENFYTVSLLFSSDLYYVVLGQPTPEVTVEYISEVTGEVVYTYPEPAQG